MPLKIRKNPSHVIPDGGKTENLGKYKKCKYIFRSNAGRMDVPTDLAIRLHLENPQRYQIIENSKILELLHNKPSSDSVNNSIAPKPDLELDFSEIDSIPGMGTKTMDDLKSIFSLAKNVSSNKEVIKGILNGQLHIPLRDDTVEILKIYFNNKYPEGV